MASKVQEELLPPKTRSSPEEVSGKLVILEHSSSQQVNHPEVQGQDEGQEKIVLYLVRKATSGLR